MKKIFTLISFVLVTLTSVKSQTFALYKVNQGGTSITGTITNNDNLTYSTSVNSETKIRLRITNTTANSYTYNVKRTIISNSPPLVVSGVSVAPQTYMCVGTTCYDNSVNTQVNVADMTVLPAGTNSDGEAMPFMIYLDEANTLGFYVVEYKVFNTTVSDTLTFTLKYNDYLTVSENNSLIESAGDVYPSPSTNTANIFVTLKPETAVKMQVHNSLGALVYNGAEQKLSGKNKLSVDCTNFTSGLYFITVTAGNAKVTKRLVVNK